MQKFDNLGESLANVNWKDLDLRPFEKNFYKVRIVEVDFIFIGASNCERKK